jgi:hypothetical protein
VLIGSGECPNAKPEQEEDRDREQEVSILHLDSYQEAEPLGPISSLTFAHTPTMRRANLGDNQPRKPQDELQKRKDGLQRHEQDVVDL